MATGIALHLGLNLVDPEHYQGWSGPLNACEADARDMADIAGKKGFSTTLLLTKQATREQVKQQLSNAAHALSPGDIFLLSYSGHGGQLPDKNNDEPDHQDETWCLYDGQLVDDELYQQLSLFKAGVRVLVFSDSCHSGTMVKQAFYHGTLDARKGATGAQPRYRFMPPDVILRTYRQNAKLYDPILANRKLSERRLAVKASVLLISGCQDNQYSQDGTFNGLFTGQLLRVWNNGLYQEAGYRKFHRRILNTMPPDQTPNFYRVGPRSAAFEAQRPFTI